ncbi:MAG: thiamine-phosphate kinase [Planctomycetota bacterium]|nr:thiamine-phosphate kinase [Planctomycetota bacterium]
MREFELLRYIYDANAALAGEIAIPPGDDMAMIRLAGRDLLAAVDQVIDGRHVRLETTPLALAGRKAVTRSLSDIAAMAVRPVGALAAVVLPPDFGAERAEALFDAIRATAADYDCPLVGGDIAFHGDASHPLTCSVTVFAEPVNGRAITRAGAEVDDVVYVTGALGGSVLEDGGGKHLTFEPRIAEAIQLAAALGPNLHAMIDLSDGLGRDASHIAEASNVQIVIDAAQIPCSAGVDWRVAAEGGEDYELLFAAAGDVPASLTGGLPVTAIGRVSPRRGEGEPAVVIRHGDETITADELGWQHES